MKVATIVGARPQFVKAAPLSDQLRKKHTEILIHTGQHYDLQMSEVFFKELNIPKPDHNLEVGSGSHAEQTAKMLVDLEKLFIKIQPDVVLTFGDTNSTLAGALAASKINIPSAHIESGLRSFNRTMPEEVNRIVADQLAEILFVPTKSAITNLKNEGITKNVFLVGDIMYDAVLKALDIAKKRSNIIRKMDLVGKDFMLATIHRADNTSSKERLQNIVDGFLSTDQLIVFPAHPRTHKFLRQTGLLSKLEKAKNILMTEPLSYFDFLILQKHAKKILTDSGGVQKEAYFFKVPCITMRDETEWIETVETGWNIIVGADKDKISKAIESFQPGGRQKNLFGDGNSAMQIVECLEKFFK